MLSALSLVTPAAALDLLSSARAHLRLGDDTSFDELLAGTLIPGVVSDIEARSGRQLLTATWRLELPRFYQVIELPRPPFQALTGITYLDDAGATQTVAPATYYVHAASGPTAKRATVWLAAGQVWPVPLAQANAVAVEFRCGYGDTAATIPPAILTAALLLVEARFDEQTDDALERAAWRLLAPFKSRSEWGCE